MAIPDSLATHLVNADYDAVESAWLERIESSPEDLMIFLQIADVLDQEGESGRAMLLLGMLDEALIERELWRVRLDLLRFTEGTILEPEVLHEQLMRTLNGLYGDRESFEGFVNASRLDRAIHDHEKLWEKLERFEGLIACDQGAIVWMDGKGAGQVVDANMQLSSFKVDFPNLKGLTVGFIAAGKLLKPLTEGHILRRMVEEPEVIAKLAKDDPSELLRMVLQSWDRPLTAAEVRNALEGIVPTKKWTSWWASARKHPQVVTKKDGRQTYTWAATTADANEATWKRFESVQPREKLALLRREGERDEDLGVKMSDSLFEIGEAAFEAGDHALAYEIATGLDKAAAITGDEEWSPERLLRDTSDPQRLLAQIEDKATRFAAYSAIRNEREDWIEIFSTALGNEDDARGLDTLSEALLNTEPERFWRFVDRVLGANHRFPAAFVWLAERAKDDERLRDHSPLRFLQELVGSLTSDPFAPYRAARIQPLCESGGTLPRLLSHLSPDQAPKAVEAIERAPGLESYQRKDLVTALEVRFPTLRQEDLDAQPIYSTAERIDQKREELRVLVQEEIPANRTAIEEARAMGDLRENFEYKSARQRHEYLSSRQAQLENELTRARPIDVSAIELSEARIGSRITFTGPSGERQITILGPWDSDPEAGILAYESDRAKQILGMKVGDSIELDGETYEVSKITSYLDD